MAVRRSARLRSLQQPPAEDIPESTTNQNNATNASTKKSLQPVIERDELPEFPEVPKTEPSTAMAKASTPKSKRVQTSSPTKTPTTAVTRPNHHEMHPSKVHQSTTKQADSGLILGFNPVKKDAQGNIIKETPAQNTPSKTNPSPASAYYGTPAFEFKFSCQDSQLSDEAKKLMESVREDVARIKSQMIHEKATQAASDSSQTGDRKIAKPKGKTSRFSDAHMAEFKKMDSIAGHPSAFRAAPGRFQPVQQNLKRTNSKARLEEPESHASPAKTSPKAAAPTTPAAKRVKHDKPAATSARPAIQSKPTIPRPRVGVCSSLLTPTRASLARSSMSLKPTRTSMIPSLARSPLSKPAEAPSTPRTEFNPRFKSNIPTLSSLKSILRRPQPLFSKDPAKIAAGTHKAAPDFTPDLLLQPSREGSHEVATTPSPKKKVEFTPSAKPDTEEVVSPSPSKKPATVKVPPTTDVVYPTLPPLTPEHGSAQKSATIRPVRPSEVPVEATLPEIPGMPHGLSHKKRHRAAEDETDIENVPPTAHTEERSAKRVKVNTPVPQKTVASSPLKPRSHTPLRSGSGTSRSGTPASARTKGRMLSTSRLNMLAQPKNRS
ncbi:hypothetical protein BJX61DRAFT_533180 [Aspergillus egyptiacus]|nr:hypothetical protein BJX61DRAFT_533180 [Aspergillus egyptiacus]